MPQLPGVRLEMLAVVQRSQVLPDRVTQLSGRAAPPSGSEAATGITAPPSFTLESALDHPLAGYVILPAVGAAVGAVTHPLQALLHRAM